MPERGTQLAWSEESYERKGAVQAASPLKSSFLHTSRPLLVLASKLFAAFWHGLLPVWLPPQQGLLFAESLLKAQFPGKLALRVRPDDLYHWEDGSPLLPMPAQCRHHVLVNLLLFISDAPKVAGNT